MHVNFHPSDGLIIVLSDKNHPSDGVISVLSHKYHPSDGVISVLSHKYHPSEGVISILSDKYHPSDEVISIELIIIEHSLRWKQFLSGAVKSSSLWQEKVVPQDKHFFNLLIYLLKIKI